MIIWFTNEKKKLYIFREKKKASLNSRDRIRNHNAIFAFFEYLFKSMILNFMPKTFSFLMEIEWFSLFNLHIKWHNLPIGKTQKIYRYTHTSTSTSKFISPNRKNGNFWHVKPTNEWNKEYKEKIKWKLIERKMKIYPEVKTIPKY